MGYHFRNLVFEGGGVKGIAYVGALQALGDKNILPDVVRVGGASAGAITATLVGLGHTMKEIEEQLWGIDFNELLDDSWGVVRDTKRLISDFGWYKGDFFREWIGKRVEDKTGSAHTTFRDLDHYIQSGRSEFKQIYCIGTNLSTGYAEIFSHEHTPRTSIADAVRISMSIPLFFAAKRSLRGDVYVDGGMLNNYPVKVFDRRKYVDNHSIDREYYAEHNARLEDYDRTNGMGISHYVYNQETLGFRLDTKAEIAAFRDHAEPPRHNVEDFFDYARAMVRTMLNAQQSVHLHTDDWHRTVYIDTGDVSSTDFALKDEAKLGLVAAGKRGVEDYFNEWYDKARETDTVWNRPA